MRTMAKSFRLFLAALLTLCLLAGAAAAEGQQDILFTVICGEQTEPVQAVPLDEAGSEFWAQVPADALYQAITVQITDLYGQYAQWGSEFGTMVSATEMSLNGVRSAGSAKDPNAAILIQAYDASGVPVRTFTLYISTEPAPVEEIILMPTAVLVVWQAEDGTVLDSTTAEIAAGSSQTFYAKSIGEYVPVDYDPSEVTVTVDGSGNASPSQVVFHLRRVPASAAITVNYVDETGASIYQESVDAPSGADTTVRASSLNGYVLADGQPGEVTVSVDAMGNPSQSVVTFVVRQLPTSAAVTVIYQDETGAQPAVSQVSIPVGSSLEIYAEAPAGYTLADGQPSVVTVSVDAMGYASQDTVLFQVRLLPTSVTVGVVYQDEEGMIVSSNEVSVAVNASQTIYAEVPAGYALADGQPGEVTVSVDGMGNPSQGTAVFMVRRLPTSAAVTVLYQDGTGAGSAWKEVNVAANASQTIYAEVPAGYVLADGQPGEVTVSVDGMGNPSQGTVSFAVRALPESATVPVLYQDETGNLIASGQAVIASGTSQTIRAEVPEGYMMADGQPSEVTVSVDGMGYPSLNSVVFVVRARPTSAIVGVIYRDENGVIIGSTEVGVGVSESVIIRSDVPAGYQLADGQAAETTVAVDAMGNASQNPVIFAVRRTAESADVEIIYQDESGNMVNYGLISIPTGTSQTVRAEVPTGYMLADGQPGEVTVSVDGAGNPSQRQVLFILKAQPASASVTVIYRLEDGTEIARREVAIPSGSQESIRVEAIPGYTLVGGQPEVQVIVDSQGNPTQREVVFILRKTPDSAAVTVRYLLTDGTEISSDTVEITTGLTHVFYAQIFNGYALADGQATEVSVTVDGSGHASQSEVVFYYRKLPQSAAIAVRYLDYETLTEIDREEYTVEGGASMLIEAKPHEDYSFPAGQPTSVQVSVDTDGRASQDEVIFYLVKIPPTPTPAPLDGTVTVRYQTVGGRDLAEPVTVKVPGGESLNVIPDPAVLNRLPDDFDRDTVAPQAVTVTATREGAVSPAEVVFTVSRIISAEETPIPVGETVERWAVTTGKGLKLRKTPSGTVLKTISNTGTHVWVHSTEKDGNGETWAKVTYNGTDGYIMSRFLNILSQGESDDYQEVVPSPVPVSDATATPVPVVVTPTATPVPVVITPTPTPTATPYVPVVTQVPAQYSGYAVTNTLSTLRYEMDTTRAVLHAVPSGTLVRVSGQYYDARGQAWSYVEELDGTRGYILDRDLNRISSYEAQPYLDAWNRAHPTATPVPVVTAVPIQQSGYAYTVGDNVMFRTAPNDRSVILAGLRQGTAVYVAGQVYNKDDWTWHSVQYDGVWGYIRSDMLRMMSEQEQRNYINSLSGTPTPRIWITPTPLPTYSGGIMSSYGYVTNLKGNSTVNVRRGPSTGSEILMRLRSYAMCLVLGSENVNGNLWYNIEYGNNRGYISGTYFKQMTISEMDEFMSSDRYLEGIRNNSTSRQQQTMTAAPVISVEDRNAQTWSDPNTAGNVAYATWAPIATTPPLPVATPTATVNPVYPTRDPYAGGQSGVATPGTEATVTYEPISTPGYEPAETLEPITIRTNEPANNGGGNGSPLGLILVILLVLVGGGAGFGFYLHTKNKKAAARRAAARRSQANAGGTRPGQGSGTGGTGAGNGSSYAQRMNHSGTQSPYQRQFPTQPPAGTGSSAKPAGTGNSDPTTGRRSRRTDRNRDNDDSSDLL